MESVETRLAKSAGPRYSRAHRQTFYWTANPGVVVSSVVDQLNVEGNAVSQARISHRKKKPERTSRRK